MSVYIDYPKVCVWQHGLACHMCADSVEELLEFAKRIGLKSKWIQEKEYKSVKTFHFDLTGNKADLALKCGALHVNRREFLSKLKGNVK